MDHRIDDWPGLKQAKQELRLAMTARLQAVSSPERSRRSAAATAVILGHQAWMGAELVLAFLSMPTEIDTLPVIEEALKAGKRVAVPRIDRGELSFIELGGDWRSWPPDRWGIPTPPEDAPALSAARIATLPSLALIPGLAFDRGGGRLGRGKGYYDRFLASVLAAAANTGGSSSFTTLAFGYEFQSIPRVPMGRQDVRLQGLALG